MPVQISVILPVYNAAPYLRQCLDSILTQIGPSFEIVLVDDGSTDESPAIYEEYRACDARVRVSRITHAGAYPARNKALDLVCGRFLMFVDADDYLEPDAMATLWNAHVDSGADFIRARLRMFYEDGVPPTYLAGADLFGEAEKDLAYIETGDEKPVLHFFPGMTVALVRADLIQRRGLRFPNEVLSGADARFCIEIAKLRPTYHYIDKVIYNYRRQTGNSITSTYTPDKTRRMSDSFGWMHMLRDFLLEKYDSASIMAAMGNAYTNAVIRYLVSCAADSVAGGDPAAFERFRSVFYAPLAHEMLAFYDPGTHQGKSWLLPWLMRKGWGRAAFLLCKRKAVKRYKELRGYRARNGEGRALE